MRLSTGRSGRVLAGVLAIPVLTGCAGTTGSAGTETAVACRAFAPIRYSREDTAESQRQSREHNAAWAALCSTGILPRSGAFR